MRRWLAIAATLVALIVGSIGGFAVAYATTVPSQVPEELVASAATTSQEGGGSTEHRHDMQDMDSMAGDMQGMQDMSRQDMEAVMEQCRSMMSHEGSKGSTAPQGQ